MQAGSIIDDAKDRAFPHIGPQKMPEGSLLRTLASLDEDITTSVSQTAPHLLSEEASEVSITNTKNSSGYSLNDALEYTSFWILDDDKEPTPVRVVTETASKRPQQHPAALVSASSSPPKLFPVDPQGEDWDGSDDRLYWDPDHTLVYRYIAAFTAPTAKSDTLTSPDIARPYLTQALVVQILQMQGDTVSQNTFKREFQRENALRSQLLQQMDRLANPQSSAGSERRHIIPRTLKDRRD